MVIIRHDDDDGDDADADDVGVLYQSLHLYDDGIE